jgi:beta-galactosidase
MANAKTPTLMKTTINQPNLWSVSSPEQYQAKITLKTDGKIIDQYVQKFGIRTVEVSAEKGFVLNGEAIELKGGCMHHDNGLLGAAAFNRAEERRVQLMKANGFNAIRTSHNPPSEAFLDACDRLGMLVIDETFDIWQRTKNPQDYHRFFNEWWRKDVESMIMRDRNHPSIIMWSIGNEINERADTSGVRIGKAIIGHIKSLDDSRPFTNAICEFWDIPGMKWEATANAFEILTVGGYNYQYLRYETDHEKYPERIMMGTESVPKDAYGNWEQVEKHPYVIGDFVWTGMDYLGETGIGHTQYFGKDDKDVFAMPWPWFNAWCGDVDIIGDKKSQMIYRDVIWGNSKLEMNVHAPIPEGKTEVVSYWGWPDEYPHWNWNGNEDKVLQVSIYTRGDSVSLSLNGREIGSKAVSAATKLTATFDVSYEPGELKAVAYENGREIAQKIFKTTGTSAAIRLTPDRPVISADRNDLSFITIEIVDEFGQVVADATNQISITISGDGEMAGSGNACPYDMKSFGKKDISTFHGKAMVIARPYAKAGKIRVSVSGKGLKGETDEITVE